MEMRAFKRESGDQQPLQAKPDCYQLRKFVTRNKGQVIAASLVLLTLVGGMAGTTIGLVKANTAAKKERAANDVAQIEKTNAEHAAEKEKAAKEQTERRLTQIEKSPAPCNANNTLSASVAVPSSILVLRASFSSCRARRLRSASAHRRSSS